MNSTLVRILMVAFFPGLIFGASDDCPEAEHQFMVSATAVPASGSPVKDKVSIYDDYSGRGPSQISIRTNASLGASSASSEAQTSFSSRRYTGFSKASHASPAFDLSTGVHKGFAVGGVSLVFFFHVHVPTPFTLAATVSATANHKDVTTSSYVDLNYNGQLLTYEGVGMPSRGPKSGVLQPGAYFIHSYIQAGSANQIAVATTSEVIASFDLQLDAPPTTDLTVSGLRLVPDAALPDRYSVPFIVVNSGDPTEAPTSVKAYWADGPDLTNKLASEPVVFSTSLPAQFCGQQEIELSWDVIRLRPDAATHLVVVLDEENQVVEQEETNNVASVELSKSAIDIQAYTMDWDLIEGGLNFFYIIKGDSLSNATVAQLFWANGPGINNIIMNTVPIFTHNIPAGVIPQGEVLIPVHVPGPSLRNAPDGTTHILLVLDRDNLVTESNESNNTHALADAQINFGPNANQNFVSAYTRSVIKDAMRFAGQARIIVGSTARSTADQARVMFEVLEGSVTKLMLDKGYTTTLAYSYGLYDSNGDKVIDTYVAGKVAGKSATEIKADMQQKIDDIKLLIPSAFKHTADPTKLQVVDVYPSSVSNDSLFQQATAPFADSRISRRLSPSTIPVDQAFHIEIPQPNGQMLVPPIQEVVSIEASTHPSIGIRPLDLDPLTPSTLLLFTNRIASGYASVSNTHQIFRFQASAGDVLSVGVDVTAFISGASATNDDSVVFLFDSMGRLMASNDDTDPFDSDFESLIAGYPITNNGTYYVGVTTFGTTPVIGGDGTISDWEDDGGSNIQFDVLISLIPSQLAIRSLGNNLAVVEWAEPGVLQESSHLQTNWVGLFLATTPHFLNMTNQQRFYRLLNH